MRRTEISTLLFNGLLVLLISATATMGMMPMTGHEENTGIIEIAARGSSNTVIDLAPKNSKALKPVMMSGSGKACCACNGSDDCLLDLPLTGFVKLFTAAYATRLKSLTSRPPEAPPRT